MAMIRQQANSGKQDISAGTEELKNLLNQIEVLSAQAKGGGRLNVNERTSEIIAQIAGLNLPNDVLRKEISKASPAVIKTLKESWSSKKSSKSYSDTPPYIALAQYSAEEKRLKELRAIFASEEAIRKKYWEPLKKSTENTLSLMDDYIKNPPQTPEEKEKRQQELNKSTGTTLGMLGRAAADAYAIMQDPNASPKERRNAQEFFVSIGSEFKRMEKMAGQNSTTWRALNDGMSKLPPNQRRAIEEGKKEYTRVSSTATFVSMNVDKDDATSVTYNVHNGQDEAKSASHLFENIEGETNMTYNVDRVQDETPPSVGYMRVLPTNTRISDGINDAIAQAQKIYRDAKLSLEKPNDSNDGMTTNMFGTAKGIDAQPADTSSGLSQLIASAQDSSSQSKGADENDFATDINAPRTPSSVKNQLAQHAHKEDETAIYGYNMFNQVERSA